MHRSHTVVSLLFVLIGASYAVVSSVKQLDFQLLLLLFIFVWIPSVIGTWLKTLLKLLPLFITLLLVAIIGVSDLYQQIILCYRIAVLLLLSSYLLRSLQLNDIIHDGGKLIQSSFIQELLVIIFSIKAWMPVVGTAFKTAANSRDKHKGLSQLVEIVPNALRQSMELLPTIEIEIKEQFQVNRASARISLLFTALLFAGMLTEIYFLFR